MTEFMKYLKDRRKISENNTKIVSKMMYKMNYKIFVNRLKSINYFKRTI